MKEQDYILLLTKQFSDELLPAEAEMLETWLAQSLENEQLAAQCRQVWAQSATYTPTIPTDLNADFQKVQDRIRAAEAPGIRIVPLGRRLLRVAALLALLAAAIWTYQRVFNPSVTQLSASASDVPKREVTLPDGSRVWLRQGSSLDFPQKFTGKERRVVLHGEAYFDIVHLAKKPFRVELPDGSSIEVLGTQFDVCQQNSLNSVLVRSGRVRFYPSQEAGPVILNPGEKAVHDRRSNATEKTNVATFNELAWQTGGLEFVKTPLSTVVTDLAQYYQVEIVLRNPALRDCLHTAPLTSQPLDKVLQSLSLTYQLKVLHTNPGRYELVGGTCR